MTTHCARQEPDSIVRAVQLGPSPPFTERKRPSEPRNEDRAKGDARRGVTAVSDGASISFDSATWSEVLSERFLADQKIGPTWIIEAIAEFSRNFDRDGLPWMQQAAYDRGTFASLLGVRRLEVERLTPSGELLAAPYEVLAIGDSLAALCDGDTLIESWPYTSPEQFDAQPDLLSTNLADSIPLLTDEALAERTVCWMVDGLADPMIFCMTDALGRWLLEHHESGGVTRLRTIDTLIGFQNFVHEERSEGRLRVDDTTLLVWK